MSHPAITSCFTLPEEPREKRGVLQLVKQTGAEWWEDDAPRHAAALSFYTALSLAPVLLIAVAVAGLVFGRDAAEQRIVGELQGTLGTSAATTIQSMIDSANKPASGLFAAIVGIVVLLFGASGVFAELQASLNRIWEVKARPGRGIRGFIRTRFLSLSMVFGVAFLLLVSLLLSAGLAAAGDAYVSVLPWAGLWQVVHFIVSFMVVTVLFAMLFKFLPDVKIGWKDVWIGAVVTGLLFTLGKLAIGQFIGRTAVESSHGAAGSVVVTLVWVYYSAQIVFFGAEFTQVYARLYGSRITASKNAVAVPDAGVEPDRRFGEPASQGA